MNMTTVRFISFFIINLIFKSFTFLTLVQNLLCFGIYMRIKGNFFLHTGRALPQKSLPFFNSSIFACFSLLYFLWTTELQFLQFLKFLLFLLSQTLNTTDIFCGLQKVL